jgi:hypothetical protein
VPTVAELRAQAAERGIALPSRARKAEIEELLAAEPKTVLEAVERDLAEMDSRISAALAASARALARELDNKKNSATSKSMCARALIDTLDRLRELAPPKEENDQLDDLTARREARRAGASG